MIIGSRRRTPSSSVSPQMLTSAESVSSYRSALEWSLGSFRSQFSSYRRAGSAMTPRGVTFAASAGSPGLADDHAPNPPTAASTGSRPEAEAVSSPVRVSHETGPAI